MRKEKNLEKCGFTVRIDSSIVEYIAIKEVEETERYKRHIAEIEKMHRNRLVRNSEKPERWEHGKINAD